MSEYPKQSRGKCPDCGSNPHADDCKWKYSNLVTEVSNLKAQNALLLGEVTIDMKIAGMKAWDAQPKGSTWFGMMEAVYIAMRQEALNPTSEGGEL